MGKLDLSKKGIAAWRAKLPDDIKVVVPDDVGEISEQSLDTLTQDLAAAGHKRFASVLHQHGEMLAAAGRPLRIRLLAWVISRSWPNAASVVRALTSDEGDEEGSSGGRQKVAPFFKADMEAMGLISTSRIVRAAADLRTIEAVAGGIRDFEMNYDMQRTGGM